MLLSEIWVIYHMDKVIEGFSPLTLKGYKLQIDLMIRHFGDVDIEDITLPGLKNYLIEGGGI